MPSRSILAVSLLGFTILAAAPAHAQETPDMGTVVMLSWKCDYGAMSDLVQEAQELWIPAAQELQDEGKLAYAQVLTHSWGDEWNLIFYFRAADMPTYLEAWESWIGKVNAADPESTDWFFEHCREHKDGFYTSVAATELP